MRTPKSSKSRDNMITIVVLRHEGGAMSQFRVPRWFLAFCFLLTVGTIGAAGWVLAQEVNYRVESEQVRRFKETNIEVAEELTKGREALLRVARLEYDLRTTQQKIIDAGLPGRVAARLAVGR